MIEHLAIDEPDLPADKGGGMQERHQEWSSRVRREFLMPLCDDSLYQRCEPEASNIRARLA